VRFLLKMLESCYNPAGGAGRRAHRVRVSAVSFQLRSVAAASGALGVSGDANAVYRHLSLLERINLTHVSIFGSDHVYHIDYRHLLQLHQEHGADVTVATFPVPRHQASQFGMVTADPLREVTSFREKPWEVSPLPPEGPTVLASMGIYLFRFAVLRAVLGEDAQRRSTHDSGRAILLGMLGRYRVAAFPFVEGIGKAPVYWRDGGTNDTSWETHMALVSPRRTSSCLSPKGDYTRRQRKGQPPPSSAPCSAGLCPSARRLRLGEPGFCGRDHRAAGARGMARRQDAGGGACVGGSGPVPQPWWIGNWPLGF
jgi:ADP-glucose pyrophosphorylase